MLVSLTALFSIQVLMQLQFGFLSRLFSLVARQQWLADLVLALAAANALACLIQVSFACKKNIILG